VFPFVAMASIGCLEAMLGLVDRSPVQLYGWLAICKLHELFMAVCAPPVFDYGIDWMHKVLFWEGGTSL
jgi:hypothetical protein